ncbi:unnamed protein product, partial [marine sediment metagenome]
MVSTLAQLEAEQSNLRIENKTLSSDLELAQNEAEQTKAREDSMRTQVAALESDVSALRCELEKTRHGGSDITNIHSDEPTVSPEIGQEPMAEVLVTQQKIEPSIEVVAQEVTAESDQQADADVENVEAPKAEAEAKPELIPEVELTKPPEVTVEDVHAADFASESDRIMFTCILSDFTSHDTGARVGAAKALAGIK